MRESRTPVRPVRIDAVCGVSGCHGVMRSTGEGLTTIGTEWRHRCEACRHEQWFKVRYPYIDYVDRTQAVAKDREAATLTMDAQPPPTGETE